jgi:hypothetical protein
MDPRNPPARIGLATAAALIGALCSCSAPAPVPAPRGDDPKPAHAGAPPPAAYLAVLRDPQEVWPAAIVGGTFRIVQGCAMVGDHLLVMPKGSTLGRLKPGDEIEGGGGEFPLASFSGRQAPWALVEPIPERCSRLAEKGLLTAGLRVRPPSRFSKPLYAAVGTDENGPYPLAPVGGELRVVDQCLMLDERLLVLPAGSFVQFDDDGRLLVNIAGAGAVRAMPGDRIVGGGGAVSAEDEPLAAMPRPLIEPIPTRCRPEGRQAVTLNPSPRVERGQGTGYRDPGSANRLAVPPPAPPPPVSNPSSCPSGTTLSFGLCRKPDGTVVRVVERR